VLKQFHQASLIQEKAGHRAPAFTCVRDVHSLTANMPFLVSNLIDVMVLFSR
jgi:hypothetical protein